MSDYTVIKNDAGGNHQLSYSGTIRDRGTNFICIDAIFGFSDRDLGYVNLCNGDLFTEWFYNDRWYNIFRIQDVHSQKIKGWYCNITRPAIITDTHVSADDLALDIFVYPDGRTLLLDEDEFADLNLSETDRQQAWQSVKSIKEIVKKQIPPFDEIID